MENMNCADTSMEETGQLKSFERNKYFYGKLMTVRDFETEQRYFKEKGHLLNRLIHGIGLVCGLEVSEPEIVAGKLWLKLSPGLALDCCGREIVVESGGTLEPDGSPSDGINYVYLKYRECLKEPVPALSNPSACEEVCCYSRIKEDFKIEVSKVVPTAAVAFAWQQVWQDRKPDIQAVASTLAIASPEGDIEAKLIITADEYLEKASCPSCDDPRVLLAVIHVAGTSVTVDADETLALRSIVYSNPMLHELLRSHLTDLDNPHRVTAEQAKALMSINSVGNDPAQEEWVENVDIKSPDGTITVSPDAAARAVNIKTTHAQVNPLEVDPALTDTVRDKHVSNSDANRWNKSLVSLDGLSNPGGGIDLVAGAGIKIDHPKILAKVPVGAAPQIRISATATDGATTGVVQMTIPKATMPQEVTRVVSAIPGHIISGNIPHHLETELPPGVMLGLVTEKGILMEQDFISQFQIIQLLAKAYGLPALPPVFFNAVAVDKEKFNIVAASMNSETEVTIVIRWWAVPGRQILELPIDKITDTIRGRVGEEILNKIAAERNVPAAEVSTVIGDMMEAISAEPSGITSASIAKAINVKGETINPVLSALVESAVLTSSGRGATRKFVVKQ